jgi:MerR family transcriptional regulator, light-induced transcriptional regulator
MSKKIQNRIRGLRKAKGLTQKDLAELLGMTQTAIANYEQGIRMPAAEKLQRIAGIFEVTIDYLVGIEERLDDKYFDITINSGEKLDELYKRYIGYLLKSNKEEARNVILTACRNGIAMKKIYIDILEKVLKEVGFLWEMGRIGVWKEHFISEVTLDIMREIKTKENIKQKKNYKIIGLTAGPELHNIGLKMIIDLLEVEGWQGIYLGSNVPVQSLIKAIEDETPDVLAISATLEYHINSTRNFVAAVKSCFDKASPKIVIGGAAFQRQKNMWKETGADYWASKSEDIINIMAKNNRI